MTIDKKIFLDEKRLLTGNLNLELKKNIMYLVQSIALYDTEIEMLIQADRSGLEAFEMCIWRRMEKISWMDKKTNDEEKRETELVSKIDQ